MHSCMVVPIAECHILTERLFKSVKTRYRFYWCCRYTFLRLKICSVVLLPVLNLLDWLCHRKVSLLFTCRIFFPSKVHTIFAFDVFFIQRIITQSIFRLPHLLEFPTTLQFPTYLFIILSPASSSYNQQSFKTGSAVM